MDNLTLEINDKTQYWISMDRSNEEKRSKAELYYKENIMPLLATKFEKENVDIPSCEHLILTLGTSYEPVVFSILALKPKRVLILCTVESRKNLDDVVYFTGIRPSQYMVEEVDSENILILYERIKEYYEKEGEPKHIYADFTGGTKAMSAGCAMAASLIGAKITYISSNFSSELRKPIPGSEKLYFIKNPYEVFGDMERKEALSLFNKMDYKTAYHIFDELDKRVPGTREYQGLKYLSLAYDQWDSLNISEALINLRECKKSIDYESSVRKDYILIKHLGKIDKQLIHLQTLDNMKLTKEPIEKRLLFENFSYLVFTLYQNAIRREAQGKYEMASLLIYRILEMLSQSRFWKMGITTDKVTEKEYNSLCIEPEKLLQKVNRIKKYVGEGQMYSLPQEIALINGYIILGALGDELIKIEDEKKLSRMISEIKGKVHSRNFSIFAHGFQFQQKEGYEKFKDTVLRYIGKYCKIESIDMKQMTEETKFITL